MSTHDLRPYQHAALEAIAGALEQGTNRVLVKAPTGTGKTIMFAGMLEFSRLRTWLDAQPKTKGARMLVIAHREELLDQAADKITRQNPGVMVTIEQGDRHASPYCDVVVASIQTLAAPRGRFHRLSRLLQRHTFRIVVVDEAHHAAAASYRTALAYLGFLPATMDGDPTNIEAATFDDVRTMETALAGWDAQAPKDRLLLGVTATPNRSDAIGLGCVFQTIAHSYALKQAIDDGWLVPIKPWVVETTEDLDGVRTTAGEFNQKDLAEAVNKHRRNMLALDAWKLYAADRSTIAFTVDVQHAHDVAALFAADGIRAKALSGETPRDERRQMLADYQAGRLQVIANCMVLTEGTDLPRTGCILHLKPTKSATLYEQMTGRGLRLFPGKADCLVIDLVDVARKHSLQAAPVLYGLPPGLKTTGEDLERLNDGLEALREKYPTFDVEAALASGRFTLRELLDRASTFDIWTVPELGPVGHGLMCKWIKVGAETYRLQYPWSDGTETLVVQRDLLGHFDVSCTLRPMVAQVLEPARVRQRTLASQIPTAQAALQLAEAFVERERKSVMKLKSKDAPWMRKPASDKQLALLRKRNIPHDPNTITKGGASDLIDLWESRRPVGGRR